VLLSNVFLAAFESTVAASTQSAIGTDFRATDNIAWLATSYLIVFVAIQPVSLRTSRLDTHIRLHEAIRSRIRAVRSHQGVFVQLDILRTWLSSMRIEPEFGADDRRKGDMWIGRYVMDGA